MAIATIAIRILAQIAEFQAEFKKAGKTLDDFHSQFSAVTKNLATVAKGFVAGLGAREIINFVSNVTDAASKIVDLSNKLGISTTAVQRLDFVAGQTGTTIESLSRAMFVLGTNVAGGNKSAAEGLNQLGLSFADLRTLAPEQQFDKVVTAIGRMTSAQERNLALTQIFGARTAQELAKVVDEWEVLSKTAPKAGEDQVKALDRAGDAADRAKKQLQGLAIQGFGNIVLTAEAAEKKLFPLTEQLHKQLAVQPGLIGAIARYNLELNETAAAADAAAKALASIKPPNLPTQPGIGPAGGLDFEALLNISRDLEKGQEGINKARKAADEYAESVKQLRDELSGAKLQGEVRKLSDAFDDLTRKQTPSAAVLDRIGKAAEDLRQRGARLTPQLQAQADASVEAAQGLEEIKKAITGLDTKVSDLSDTFETDLAAVMQEVNSEIDQMNRRVEFMGDLFESDLGPAMKFIRGEIDAVAASVDFLGEQFTGTASFATQFKDLLGTIPQTLASAFTGGGGLKGAIKSIVSQVGSIIGSAFGPIGQAIGSLAGSLVEPLAKLFDRNKGRDLVKDFAASFGGFEVLQKRLDELGEVGRQLSLQGTKIGRNNVQQAKQWIEDVTKALDEFGTPAERAQKRIEGIGLAITGVNAKAALFAAPFLALSAASKEADADLDKINAKIAETAQRSQGEFERLGTFAAAAFAGMVNETGDAIGAIQSLTPTFAVLRDGVEKFGLTTTGTISELLSMFSLVNDAVTGPIIQSIQATGQIFAGLQQGGILTSSLFQTVATDIGASFRELEAKGGDVAKALALSQPVLQRLWEAQQIYGEITDETTRKLIEQAQEQGIVGAHMRDVNQKILDVLIAIANVFGATLPESFRKTETAARETARGIESEFRNIDIPPIKVPIEYDNPGFDVGEFPRLASGGIVRRPTLALVGESGPEAVIPLSSGAAPLSGTTTAIIKLDGRTVTEVIVPHLPGVIREYVGP